MTGAILAASDLSSRSDRAVERAARLASEKDWSLTVLHVIDDSLPTSLAEPMAASALRQLQDQTQSAAAPLASELSVEIEFGSIYRTIIGKAETLDATLIVLGMHRESAGLFRGTTVERVIRAGNRPCLLVTNPAVRPYAKVLVGIDFSVHSRRAVELATLISPGADLTLLHAYHVPYRGLIYAGRDVPIADTKALDRDIRRQYEIFLAGIDYDFADEHLLACEGSAETVLRQRITAVGIDLLVLGTHGRAGIAHAILGSVAEDFLRDPPCDVAVVKAW
jgi:nucleotide-binding universal stress UspA family protein